MSPSLSTSSSIDRPIMGFIFFCLFRFSLSDMPFPMYISMYLCKSQSFRWHGHLWSCNEWFHLSEDLDLLSARTDKITRRWNSSIDISVSLIHPSIIGMSFSHERGLGTDERERERVIGENANQYVWRMDQSSWRRNGPRHLIILTLILVDRMSNRPIEKHEWETKKAQINNVSCSVEITRVMKELAFLWFFVDVISTVCY